MRKELTQIRCFHAASHIVRLPLARCQLKQVFLVQLVNGNFGYQPTETAVRNGSYSGSPASTPSGPEDGQLLVERILQELEAVFHWRG